MGEGGANAPASIPVVVIFLFVYYPTSIVDHSDTAVPILAPVSLPSPEDPLQSFPCSRFQIVHCVLHIVPVSYTHLDVYKRQGQDGAAVVTQLDPGLFAMAVDSNGHLILTHNDNEPAPPLEIQSGRLVYTAVSYTHLNTTI